MTDGQKVITALGITSFSAIVLCLICKDLNIKRLNYSILGYKLKSSLLNIAFLIANPSGKSFLQRRFFGNVYVNDMLIGSVSDSQGLELKACSSVPVGFQLSMDGSRFKRDATRILDGTAGIAAVVSVRGRVVIDNVELPVSLSYKVI
jgi:LEA14-like dessication related protein